jgi:hypothetical protein
VYSLLPALFVVTAQADKTKKRERSLHWVALC